MYRAVTIALASTLLILAPNAVLARGAVAMVAEASVEATADFPGIFERALRADFQPRSDGSGRIRAMPGAWHGAHVNRHVVAHRFQRRRVFVGGFGDYYYCYPVWNGYAWVNSCNYDY